MIKTLYFAMEIRGADGELASQAKIDDRLRIACGKAAVLVNRFPTIKWIIPHENEIVNMMHRLGLVSSQDIISAERAIIRSPGCDGVVSVGTIHADGGVDQETATATAHAKFLCSLDDVNEKDWIGLAVKISAWNESHVD